MGFYHFTKTVEEATVNLRYVTSGNIQTDQHDKDPETSKQKIQLSLQVRDEGWKPIMGLTSWNENLRTFKEVCSVK